MNKPIQKLKVNINQEEGEWIHTP